MSARKEAERLKRVASAANNMSALIDEIVKKARRNFRDTGNADVDARFLKESVGALRELYGLLGICEAPGEGAISVQLDREIAEWGK